MEGRVNKAGGGNCAVKGIIEEAKARGIITAGDFVEFIKQKTDESGTYGEDTELYNTASKNYEAILLSENRVAIGSIKYSGSSALYVTVCEFSNMTIQIITNKAILTTNNSSDISFSMCALNENKFCVFYHQGTHGFVCQTCEIVNNEIVNTSSSDNNIQIQEQGNFIALSENHIIGIYLISNFVNIVIISIDGNKAKIENKYLLTGQKGFLMRLKKLSNNRMLAMIYSGNTASTWDFYLFTVGEDTLVINDKKQFESSYIGNTNARCTSLKLNYNKIILFYSSLSVIYACIININTDTIDDISTEVLISQEAYCGQAISPILIDANNIILLHSSTNNYYLYSLQCNIQEDIITVSTDTQISAIQNSGNSISNIANETGLTFIAHSHSSSNYLYGMMYDTKIEKVAQKVQSKQSTIARHSKNKCKRRTTC